MNLCTRLKKHSPVLALSLAAGLALAILAAGCDDTQSKTTTPSPEVMYGSLVDTIVVTGMGQMTAAPDKATIQVAVENEGPTSAAALDANSKDTQKVLERLKAEGVTEDQIATTGVVVYPNRYYDQQSGQEKITGYHAQNTLTVTFKNNLDTIDQVFAAMTEAGADNVYGPTWQLSEDSAVIGQVLTKAIANARLKAEAIAADQGVRLGEAINISESSGYGGGPIYDYPLRASAEQAGSVTEPPIVPQNIDVTASVTVTYRMYR